MFDYLHKRFKRANRHVPLLAAALLVAPATWAQVTIPAGNPVGTTNRKPYGNFFGFERSAAIYTAADLSATGSITSVGFYLQSITAPVAAVPAKIYLKTTTNTLFAAGTTVAAEETGATLVYDATIPAAAFAAGTWVTVTLTTPFVVTAADNLEVIVEANGGGGGTEGSTAKAFRFSAAGANRFQSWQGDGAAPTTTGTLGTARPNIQLAGLTPVACAAPSGLTLTTSGTTASVAFTAGNGNTGYTLTYTPTGGTAITQTVTASPVVLTGLTPLTTYAVSLVGNCAGGVTSAATTGSFTTSIVNDNPTGAIDLPIAAICTPVNGTNVGATTTTPAGYTNPGCGAALTPIDVWYKFTTAATGVGSTGVAITVTGAPAGQVRVFSSTGGAAGPFTQVGCAASTAFNTVAPALTIRGLTPSTTYYVFVSGYGSGDTPGAFTICATSILNDDVTVAVIQTLGTVSSTYGSPVMVRAIVRNNGVNAQTALPVTLTVAGATTFTNTQTVASLAAGASTTVTFTAYPVTAAGVNTLTVSVPADDNLTNNSLPYSQTVTTGTQGYIDTTQPFAGGAVGIGAVNGILAVRYSSSSAAAVTTVTPTFQGAGTAGTTYQVLIYNSNAGVPGTLLYTSPTLTRPTTTGPVATAVPSIPVSGDFFVGIKELDSNLALANQVEDPLRASTFFFTVTNGTTWVDVNTTTLKTRLALDVTLSTPVTCGVATSLAVTNITTTTASIGFTAPASGTSYTVTYTPASGTATTITPAPTASPVALIGLTPNTTYTVSVTTNCAAGQTSGSVTTTFTTLAVPPANDLCSAAIALACGVPVTGTTVNATMTGDPTVVCSVGSPLTPSATPGVFYSFAGNGQVATVTTCSGPTATAGDTKLFVYSGSCGTLTCVGNSDDIGAAGCGTNTRASTVVFPTLAGTNYYIFVQYFPGSAGPLTGPFGLSLTCAVPVVTTYATLPVSESFEGPWVNGLGTRDLPSASWRNTPSTGNNSWRRDDDGASAGWTFATSGGFMPTSSQGARSARFHSSWANGGPVGSLDLYANMSGVGTKTLTFDYVNPTSSTTNPADKLDVLVSTDGGVTFATAPVLTVTNNATFAAKTVVIPSTSATTVIRFRALADFGTDDIGIDNVQLRVITATRNEALAATVGLYPNPAHQRFQLSVPTGLRAASATLSNALGQVVQARQLNLPATGGTADFNVSSLAPGVYTLTLKSGADLVVKRVVVE